MKLKRIISFLLISVITAGLFGCTKSPETPSAGSPGTPGTSGPSFDGQGSTAEKLQAHLDEKYQDYEEVPYGLDITKKTDLISICYSLWFRKILQAGTPPVVSEILEGNGEWGRDTQFHFWGRPALGIYRSDDKDVIRTHMTQLADAGIDFIVIDYTYLRDTANALDWRLYVTDPMTVLLDTILEMRAEGLKTPYVVPWAYVNDTTGWEVVNALYEQFYTEEKWQDCFVYWENKPFMLTNRIIENPPEQLTLRAMWGLRQNVDVSEWSFLNIKNVQTTDADGFAEQTCVCVAAQETYMTSPSAHGRNHGIFFYTQWARAFEYHPKVITLTWWNEWAAQLFRDGDGNPQFVDNYNTEYSRDIEPMEGGHGDQYYKWMCEYIRAYRAGEACPVLVESGYEEEAAKSRNADK